MHSLLAFISAIDFYMLILYPETFLNLLISSRIYFVNFLRFPCRNRGSFTSNMYTYKYRSPTIEIVLLLICMPFISFSCLNELAKTSSTVCFIFFFLGIYLIHNMV